jgi:hypothetical protein
LPLADWRFLKHREMFGTGRDPHRFRLPQAEGVDRTARPGAAGIAVAIAHRLGRASDLDLDRSAKAFSFKIHFIPHDLKKSAVRLAPAMRCEKPEKHHLGLRNLGPARPSMGIPRQPLVIIRSKYMVALRSSNRMTPPIQRTAISMTGSGMRRSEQKGDMKILVMSDVTHDTDWHSSGGIFDQASPRAGSDSVLA